MLPGCGSLIIGALQSGVIGPVLKGDTVVVVVGSGKLK